MLEINNLTRWYGDFKAVDNVSFKLTQGEIVGLLGHNGAGKTTIMKMLSGFLEANSGDITFEGNNIQNNLKQVQSMIGYLPENLPIYAEMTVADYLDYAAQLKGISPEKKVTELRRVIAATQLKEKLIAPIATLSRGYKQRVGVAQAILGDPKLLILDEPTNGLDPTQTEQMRQLIRDIAKRATVILSTHIMQEVDALCDRAIIIRNGQLAVDEKLENLRITNSLLLTSSIEIEKLRKLLRENKMFSSIETNVNPAYTVTQQTSEKQNEYRIHLAENTNSASASALIARTIVETGAALFSIAPEHRDLDTLFKQVNQGLINQQGMKNAA